MSDNIILTAKNISKQYRLGLVGTGTISHDLNRWWSKIRGKEDPFLKVGESNDRATKGTSDYVWALKDINFEVKKGEVLGIIGKNGAGKSTLLKILSRVTGPTTGEIRTKGRIASLLEVGTGFHGEMTGRENIYLNGAILGMTKSEINSKIDEIIEFSGCERYVDTPVKRYSSGMTVRLAFAVAAHLEPEILVIDEVLAVGDAEFQKKAIGKMQDISRGEGRTVLFVSHNMAAVKSLCTRALVLEHGTTVFDGDTDDAVDYYLNHTKNKSKNYYALKTDDSENYIKSVKVITNNKGFQDYNNDFKVEIVVHSSGRIQYPAISYQILNSDNIPLLHELILNSEQKFCQEEGEFELISIIRNIKLYQGEYKLNVYFADNFTKVSFERLIEICNFEIINSDKRPYYWKKGTAVYKENDTQWNVIKLDEAEIDSPLNRNEGKAKLVETFSTSKITSSYNAVGIDVKRFFKDLNTVGLYECNKTGYRFYYPFSTIGDADFYKDLSLNHKNYYSTRWEHLKILTILKPNEKVLEIGSGFGAFLNLLKSKSIVAEGIELNLEAIKKCKKEGLQIHDMLIDDFSKTHFEQYDVVCFFQVLEHITNVYDFIKSSVETLKPNGKLIIGVPNNNPYLFVKDKYHTLNLPPHHAGLWNKKSLKSLEKIFSIKLESVNYEPLVKSYSEFLKAYIENSNYIYSKTLLIFNKIAPIILKKILSKCINGRNILVVFRKIA